MCLISISCQIPDSRPICRISDKFILLPDIRQSHSFDRFSPMFQQDGRRKKGGADSSEDEELSQFQEIIKKKIKRIQGRYDDLCRSRLTLLFFIAFRRKVSSENYLKLEFLNVFLFYERGRSTGAL